MHEVYTILYWKNLFHVTVNQLINVLYFISVLTVILNQHFLLSVVYFSRSKLTLVKR